MNTINVEIWSFPQTPQNFLTKDYLYDLIMVYIKQGILHPGQALPPYRKLAKLNGLCKTTVQQLYKTMEENGWLHTVQGSGTFVASKFPGYGDVYPACMAVERLPISLGHNHLKKLKEGPHFHDFLMIGPDTPSPHYLKHLVNLLRMKKYADVYNISSQLSRMAAMEDPRYKTEILEHLISRRNFKISASNLEVIVGRRECLEQVFSVLLKPADVMVNTSPKDRKLYHILKAQPGVQNVLVTFDDDFLHNLKNLLNYTKIKALYIRPQCSYPESYTLSPEACTELIALAKQHSFYIIEEDDYHECWHEKKPFKPLISHNHCGHVIYLGALSIISCYLRQIRTIVAAAEFMVLLQRKRIIHSQFRDLIADAVVVDQLETGKLWKAVELMQREHSQLMFEACMQVDNALNKVVTVKMPLCGLSIWLTFPSAGSLAKAMSLVEEKGFKIPYLPGTQRPGNGVVHIRLGIGTWNNEEAQGPIKVLLEKFSV